jgi:transcriptional regulator with XRE-family HTH domain
VLEDKDEKRLYALMGKRITELRKKAGYTSQETFAYDAEIPRALYGRYEKGANLTLSSLYRILKFHEISFKDFFKEGFEEL